MTTLRTPPPPPSPPAGEDSADQSPFVTVFARLGVPGAAAVMNLVVLTAAPRFTARMNRGRVQYGGILLTASFGVLGVVLNHVMPVQAFEVGTRHRGRARRRMVPGPAAGGRGRCRGGRRDRPRVPAGAWRVLRPGGRFVS